MSAISASDPEIVKEEILKASYRTIGKWEDSGLLKKIRNRGIPVDKILKQKEKLENGVFSIKKKKRKKKKAKKKKKQ